MSVTDPAAQPPHAPPTAPPVEHPVARAGIAAYGRRALIVLFILNAVDELDRAVLAVSLERIREDFRLDDATVGLLPLAVIFITGLLSLPAGNLADRVTRTKILAYGSIVWGGAGLLAAGSVNFVMLFFTRALLGVGQATINPTHASLLSDYYPVSVRGRVLGYHRAANPLGQVLGAVIGGAIVAAVGWRWGFVAAAIPGLLFGMFALTLREPKRGESDLKAAVDGNPLLAEFLREPTDAWGFRRSLGTIFGIRTLRYLIFANAAFGFTLIGIVFWLPALFERRYGFSTEQAGLAFGLLALCAFIGTWYGGPLADRNLKNGFDYVGQIAVVAAAVLVASWTFAFAFPVAALTITLLCAGAIIASAAVPGFTALVAACAPPRVRSQAFAAFGLALAVCGAAAAPLVVGAMSELFQHQWDVSEGDSLRYAMTIATATVMSLGTWFLYQASRSATSDAQRVLADFLAEHTGGASATSNRS
jgi:branched-chain amino acid transport system ATP-binding protein